MITSGNLIKIDKNDLDTFKQQKQLIDKMNQKMVMLRQKQIYTALSTATRVKIDFFQKIQKWMNMLENKIFNQQLIDSMDLNKAISLMKFVSNTALKLLAQMNDMEDIFKTYIEMQGRISEAEKPHMSQDNDDLKELKKSLFETLSNGLKEQSEVVSPNVEMTEPIIDIKIDDEKLKKDVLTHLGTGIPELTPEKENKKSGAEAPLDIDPEIG